MNPNAPPFSPLRHSPSINRDYTPRYSDNITKNSSPESAIPDRYHEVAASTQTYPVARLLDQIAALRNELAQAQQNHNGDHSQLKERHETELKQLRETNHGLKEEVKQLRSKHKEQFDRLLEKVKGMEDSWSVLEMRTSSIKSEISGLQATGSVRDYDSKPDLSAQVDTHRTTKLQPWEEEGERKRLLVRQNKLDATIKALQSEAKSLNQFIKQLQERLNTNRAVQKDRDFEINDFKLRNTAYSNIFKDLHASNRSLEANLQHQSQLFLKACDINQLGEQLNETDPGACQGRAPGSLQPANGPPFTEEHSAIKSITGPSQSKPLQDSKYCFLQGHKRTLSELIDNDQDSISKSPQRRRTGSESYVSVPNQAETWREGVSRSWENGPPRRDLTSNWRTAPADQKSWNTSSDSLLTSERGPFQKDTVGNADFWRSKLPFEAAISNLQGEILLPTKRPGSAGNSTPGGDCAFAQTSHSTQSLSENGRLGSVPGRNPWQPSDAKAKRWQNSMLRLGR